MHCKSLTDRLPLSNGVTIPCVGFGTWQTPDGETTVKAVKAALKAGYRHIDAAAVYGNEKSVGRAIAESGVPRKDLFVTSKLFNTDHTYQKTQAAFEKTLADLGLDYLDLYLIHWPNPIDYRATWAESNAETWRAFEEQYKAGRIRAIGVSNFRAGHLDALEKAASVKPMVNQIRLCPGDAKDEVVKTSRDRGMLVEAYSPLGGTVGGMRTASKSLLQEPLLADIAARYGKSPAQVCIRWCLQMGFLPLPKATTEEHIKANAEVFDFELSTEEVESLRVLEGYPDPFPHPDNITW